MSERPLDQERLLHIIEAIDRIYRFTEDMTFEDFLANEMAQFAIIKNFEIIGEAAYYIDHNIKASFPEVEWRKITAFRHILVHDYYKINMEIVWNAREKNLLELKGQVESCLCRMVLPIESAPEVRHLFSYYDVDGCGTYGTDMLD